MAEKLPENKKQSEIEGNTAAVQELTKAVGEMTKELTKLKEEWAIFRKQGRFVLVLGLTALAGIGALAC